MTDTGPFDAIYRAYRPKVCGYIRSHIQDSGDVEDLCSEVFRKALEHYDAAAGRNVSSYLYTITRNTVIDYARTRRVEAPLSEDVPADGGPEETAISTDMLARLAAALQRLSEREREIIVLHYHADNSLQEISDKMSLPYGVVKRAHQSALRHLRALLAPEESPAPCGT